MRIDVVATTRGLVVESAGTTRMASVGSSIDELFTAPDPSAVATEWFESGVPCDQPAEDEILAPIAHQEVWAAGVTYLRSRVARVAESKDTGGDTFYDLVYDAERPELFLKATPHRVVGHKGSVRIREDSTWDVPEPEFTLAINTAGEIFGYTIGNDMSSRSIEGENPLYLPQAKCYSACAGLGPRIVIADLPPADTAIRLAIVRGSETVFTGETELAQIKRGFSELAEYLFRDNDFPAGAFLMTGTGVVPGDDFTLQSGDEIHIEIGTVGTLINIVA